MQHLQILEGNGAAIFARCSMTVIIAIPNFSSSTSLCYGMAENELTGTQMTIHV